MKMRYKIVLAILLSVIIIMTLCCMGNGVSEQLSGDAYYTAEQLKGIYVSSDITNPLFSFLPTVTLSSENTFELKLSINNSITGRYTIIENRINLMPYNNKKQIIKFTISKDTIQLTKQNLSEAITDVLQPNAIFKKID